MRRLACFRSNQQRKLFEQNARIFYRRARNALNFQFDAQVAQLPESGNVLIVYRNARSNLAPSLRHMHIAYVNFLDRHASADKCQNIRRVIDHEKNQLIGRRLMDHIDGLLQRKVPHGDTFGSGHVHKTLANIALGNAVVGNKDQIRPNHSIPLSNDLPMNEPVVDTR